MSVVKTESWSARVGVPVRRQASFYCSSQYGPSIDGKMDLSFWANTKTDLYDLIVELHNELAELIHELSGGGEGA